ncbi:hypothetical protein, partial [Paenibacillus xylanexedens]|uniref:hypothetical protein n=1 Tax=Paenibacillus xylanexedens TaxID=528191 RepID=UPI0021B1F804
MMGVVDFVRCKVGLEWDVSVGVWGMLVGGVGGSVGLIVERRWVVIDIDEWMRVMIRKGWVGG